MRDPMYTDFRHVTEPLRLIAQDTAATLGSDWKVEGLLSTAMIVHPVGIRLALDNGTEGTDCVVLTAHVSVSRDRAVPLETITAEVGIDDDHVETVRRVVKVIRTEMLAEFAREDAVAGLRVLSLPLREAGINAIAQGTSDQVYIEYRKELLSATSAEYEDGERRPLGVIITALRGDDSTRVEIRIPHLSIREAARITEGLRPGLGHPVHGIENMPTEVRDELAVTFPGMTARRSVSNVPQYTDLKDDTGVLTIRHALETTRTDEGMRHRSWAAVWLRDATVAQALMVLSAYAA
ncbi:hypothetical protein [Streptomyces noursei]